MKFAYTNKIVESLIEITELKVKMKLLELNLNDLKVQFIQCFLLMDNIDVSPYDVEQILNNVTVGIAEEIQIKVNNLSVVFEELNVNSYFNFKLFLNFHKLYAKNLISKGGVLRNRKQNNRDVLINPEMLKSEMNDLFRYLEFDAAIDIPKFCVFIFKTNKFVPFENFNEPVLRICLLFFLKTKFNMQFALNFLKILSRNKSMYFKLLNSTDSVEKNEEFILHILFYIIDSFKFKPSKRTISANLLNKEI